jgi:hypothetical protein
LVVALAAAVVIAVGLSKLDLFGGRHLDVRKTEAAVRQILTNPTYGYGVENVGNISCNDGENPSVRKGGTFTCVVAVNGTKRHVTVLITDDNGTYEVDRPR